MINYAFVQRVKKALFEIDGVEKTKYTKQVHRYNHWVSVCFVTKATLFAQVTVKFDFEFIEIEYGEFKNKLMIRIPFSKFEEEKFKETLLKVFELYDEINEDKEI